MKSPLRIEKPYMNKWWACPALPVLLAIFHQVISRETVSNIVTSGPRKSFMCRVRSPSITRELGRQLHSAHYFFKTFFQRITFFKMVQKLQNQKTKQK